MKKKENNPTPMFGYKVGVESNLHSSEHSAEPYGSWSESWTNDLNRIISKTDNRPDIVSSLDIPVGWNALVVWVEYSTGNSFGHADCGSTELIGIFLDMNSATKLRSALESFKPKSACSEFEFKTPDGQVFFMPYVPWLGYFERLNKVHIDVVTVF